MIKNCNTIIMVLATLILLIFFVNVEIYPEVYFSTWKYHLHNDLKRGDVEAIQYYQNTYLSKGKILFDDIEININTGEIQIVNK